MVVCPSLGVYKVFSIWDRGSRSVYGVQYLGQGVRMSPWGNLLQIHLKPSHTPVTVPHTALL